MLTKALVLIFLRVLREYADELAPSLTTLFNIIVSTCTLPEEWKCYKVVPIYKKGKKYKLIITDQYLSSTV